MNTAEKGYAGFATVTREQWKARAVEDLKGADFDRKLVWKTDDGFSVQPFYTSEDLAEKTTPTVIAPSLCGNRRQWINYTQVSVHDLAAANRQAVEMLSFGATGILFQVPDPEAVDFATLLQGLDPTELQLSFLTRQPSTALVQRYFAFLAQQGISLGSIQGFYSAEVLEEWITRGEAPDFTSLAAVIRAAGDAPGFKALVVQSHAFVNAGASTTQELALTLNKLTDYFDQLTEEGLSASQLSENLWLHLAIGGDYFFELAKLRAVRRLLANVLEAYGVTVPVPILSSNSVWSKSFYDPNVNLLRNTTEAMSAVLGGCDALLSYPHDNSYAQPTTFSRRIALNISNLLKEESYFDKVVDPACGSYFLEALTATLAEKALDLFKQIEAEGGFSGAFRKGIIQQWIGDLRQKKEKEIASRKRVYVGTNKYPNPQEKTTAPERQPSLETTTPLLVPQRATQLFEPLRSRTIQQYELTGYRPKVYLACFGNLALRKARAGFASEFFGTAGFEVQEEAVFEELQRGVQESAGSEADVVVLCASDADYETTAMAFAEQFKQQNTEKLLVLAGYPEALVEGLQKAGVDAFVHLKSNAVDLLTAIQEKLFAALPERQTALEPVH